LWNPDPELLPESEPNPTTADRIPDLRPLPGGVRRRELNAVQRERRCDVEQRLLAERAASDEAVDERASVAVRDRQALRGGRCRQCEHQDAPEREARAAPLATAERTVVRVGLVAVGLRTVPEE
jgi:hypothetical protein